MSHAEQESEMPDYEPFFARKSKKLFPNSGSSHNTSCSDTNLVQVSNKNHDSSALTMPTTKSSLDFTALFLTDYPDPESPSRSDPGSDRLYVDLDPPTNSFAPPMTNKDEPDNGTTAQDSVENSKKRKAKSKAKKRSRRSDSESLEEGEIRKSKKSKKSRKSRKSRKNKNTRVDKATQTEFEYFVPIASNTSWLEERVQYPAIRHQREPREQVMQPLHPSDLMQRDQLMQLEQVMQRDQLMQLEQVMKREQVMQLLHPREVMQRDQVMLLEQVMQRDQRMQREQVMQPLHPMEVMQREQVKQPLHHWEMPRARRWFGNRIWRRKENRPKKEKIDHIPYCTPPAKREPGQEEDDSDMDPPIRSD